MADTIEQAADAYAGSLPVRNATEVTISADALRGFVCDAFRAGAAWGVEHAPLCEVCGKPAVRRYQGREICAARECLRAWELLDRMRPDAQDRPNHG